MYPAIVSRRFGERYLSDFVEWEKMVGGRFWGYRDRISEGSYSDDTQLSLSVARCIDEYGDFDADKFAYLELPLWLLYERGGGRSVKAAARSIIRIQQDWRLNFYKQGTIHYRNAGANGAAMRVLPIGLVNVDSPERLYRDAFLNAITTHGHPRAILGTILYASAAKYLLGESRVHLKEFNSYLHDVVNSFSKPLGEHEWLQEWIDTWDAQPMGRPRFRELFQKTRSEATSYLQGIERLAHSDDRDYYAFTGALSPSLKGSGVSTVLVAVYLFSKYNSDPEEAVLRAVNMLGSDTDTIASFVGGLFGAYYGLSAVPSRLLDRLQDKDYILRVAKVLHDTVTGQSIQNRVPIASINRTHAFMRLLAWEIGLREMFWDALTEGDFIVHPALGRGRIQWRKKNPIGRKGYEVKLIAVAFDCGQTCIFHSRVAKDGEIAESLSKDLLRNCDESANHSHL
jgi:ADP-ribosylglycohydrolase